MGPRCSSAETQVCHRSYIIAAMHDHKSGGAPHSGYPTRETRDAKTSIPPDEEKGDDKPSGKPDHGTGDMGTFQTT